MLPNSIVPSSDSGKFQTFRFEELEVMAFAGEDGEPRFVGNQVCKALNLADAKQALDRLDEDERGMYAIPTGGGIQQTVCITEAGLYRLIFTSRKEAAERFKRWLSHEVLPAIRKTGSYQSKALTPAELFAVQAQINLDHERQLADHDTRIAQLESGQIAEYFTILGYYVHIEKPPPMIDVARSLGKRATALSHSLGYEVKKVPDERHGEVGSYHQDVLKQLIK